MRLVDLNKLASEPLSHDPDISKRVAFRAGNVPHLMQLATTRIPPGRTLAPHRHTDMHEIFIVMSGHGELRGAHEVLALMPGACIHVQPQESHAFGNTGTDDLVLLYFGLAD